MNAFLQFCQWIDDHKVKILGTVGLVATSILQAKVQQPDFLTATQTTWLTIIAQISTGGTIAAGVANTLKQPPKAP